MNDTQTVGLFQMPPEAHLAKIALVEAGIPAFVENENYLDGDGPTWPADGVRVTVRAEDAEKARGVLERDDRRR
jgi:hypothetical protein